MKKVLVEFTLNGEPVEVAVPPHRYLTELLREELELTGTKEACDMGVCGSCSVLVDGELMSGCLTPVVRLQGKEVVTVEGLGSPEALDPIQEAFIHYGATQCGYCTPGMVVACRALLRENPHPTEEEVCHYLAGNLCRCTGYARIVRAVLGAAEGKLRPEGGI